MRFRHYLLIFTLLLGTASFGLLLSSHATVNEVTAANRYTGDGSTKIFSYTFKIFAKTDIDVLVDSTTKTVDSDYTVSGLGASGGGSVTFSSPPANASIVTLIRKQPASQSSTYVPNEAFPAARLEKDFDKLVMQVQQLKEQLSRTWTFGKKSTQSGSVDEPTVGYFARAKSGGGIDWAQVVSAGSVSVPVAVNQGGTGSTTASGAATNLSVLPLAGGAMTPNAFITELGGISLRNFGPPAGIGELRRTGTVLQFHDGTRAATLLTPDQSVRNPIINGGQDVWQRGTSFAAAADGQYASDRFQWKTSGATSVVTLNRSTNVPTVGGPDNAPLFNYSLEVDVTTADTSIASTDTATIRHKIEGVNWRYFAQRPIIVSFWVMSSKTGLHSFAIRNAGTDRYFIGTFTINAADTWEWESVAIDASPSAGTWDYTTGIGAELIWTLMCGSNFQGTLTTWTIGSSYCASGQVNVMDSTSNFFRVTGVQMQLGSAATPYQAVMFESELARCMRYYQKSFLYGNAPANNSGTAGAFTVYSPFTATSTMGAMVFTKVPMRSTITTVTTYNPSAANAQARNVTDAADDSGTAVTATTLGDSSFGLTFTPNAANTVGDVHAVHWTVDLEL